MAIAYVELPEGWGPSRVILVAWKRAGYAVSKLMCTPPDPNLLLLNGKRPRW
jgi:hypothetical protein